MLHCDRDTTTGGAELSVRPCRIAIGDDASGRFHGWRWLLALVVLSGVSNFTRTADAGCGDYLGSEFGTAHAWVQTVDDATIARPVPPTVPCEGTQCRQAPDPGSLPLPLRIAVQLSPRDVLGVAASAWTDETLCRWRVDSESDVSCRDSATRFFRPPRDAS